MRSNVGGMDVKLKSGVRQLLEEPDAVNMTSSRQLQRSNTRDAQKLVRYLERIGGYSVSLSLMQHGGASAFLPYLATIIETRCVTLFLPTDNAFRRLKRTTVQKMMKSPVRLRKFLTFQALSGVANSYFTEATLQSLLPGTPMVSLEGSLLYKQPEKQRVVSLAPVRDGSASKKYTLTHPNLYLGAKLAAHGVSSVVFPPDY